MVDLEEMGERDASEKNVPSHLRFQQKMSDRYYQSKVLEFTMLWFLPPKAYAIQPMTLHTPQEEVGGQAGTKFQRSH